MRAWLLGALLFASAVGPVNAGPGQVLVVFKIDSDLFKSGLNPKTGETEATLAANLSAELQQKYRPLQFVTSAPADGAAATFTASLRQDDSVIPTISIRWSAKVGASDLPMPDLRDWPIYESSNPIRPYRAADKLVAKVKSRIETWIQNDAIYPKVHDEFVRHVPLANHVRLDNDQQAVVIPLRWLDAQLSDNSTFRLEFTRATPPSDMKVVLNGVAERRLDPDAGSTQSRVFSCAASGAPVQTDMWTSCIAILEQPNPPPYLVSIEHYEFGAQLAGVGSGGTAVQP